MRYLHTIAAANTDLVASADITPVDLPVNPLSILVLRFQITNTSPAAIGTYSAVDDVLTQITAVRVAHKGEDIVNGSLRDIAALMAVRHRAYFGAATLVNTDNAVRSLALPIILGRRAYDPMSAFPATTRGNLRFFMTAGADGAGYDDINYSLETVELIDAEPEDYCKFVTTSATSVAGQFDVSLPIGNPLLGLLLFDTGLAASSDEVLSWGTVKLLKDGVEQYFPLSDYETLAAMFPWQAGIPDDYRSGHIHLINDGAALSDSDDAERVLSTSHNGYAWLCFDPLRGGEYQLETEGAADLKLRGNGDEATAVRVIPLERVTIKK